MVAWRGKKNFENGHTKLKLLRFEVDSGKSGQCGQVTIELNSATVELLQSLNSTTVELNNALFYGG